MEGSGGGYFSWEITKADTEEVAEERKRRKIIKNIPKVKWPDPVADKMWGWEKFKDKDESQ